MSWRSLSQEKFQHVNWLVSFFVTHWKINFFYKNQFILTLLATIGGPWKFRFCKCNNSALFSRSWSILMKQVKLFSEILQNLPCGCIKSLCTGFISHERRNDRCQIHKYAENRNSKYRTSAWLINMYEAGQGTHWWLPQKLVTFSWHECTRS